MNKPITNRVRNGAWGKDAVHKKDSPAKQSEVVLSSTTPGEEKTREVQETVKVAGDVLDTPEAVGGGDPNGGWDGAMTGMLSEGRTYDQLAAAGHGTVEGLKQRFPGYEGNTGRGADTEKTVTKTETYTTPDTKTSYSPQIEKTTDAITPWENRWNRRVDKQNERWSRQEARKDLRNIAKQEARNIRQEGGGLGEGWKARRDVMTGRANLSAKEQELYNTSRGIDARQQNVIDTRRGRDQLEQGASGDDKVKSVYDFSMADAGTQAGEQTLKTYERTLGGEAELGTGKGSGSSTSKANKGGLSGRKAARQSAKQASKSKAAQEATASAKTGIESDILSASNKSTSKKLPNLSMENTSFNDVEEAPAFERLQESKVSVAPKSRKGKGINPVSSKDLRKVDLTKPADRGMSGRQLADLNEAITDNRNYKIAANNRNLGIETTGNQTGNRSESRSYEANARKKGAAEVARKAEAEKASRSPMYMQNVGFKAKSPLKKGYFK